MADSNERAGRVAKAGTNAPKSDGWENTDAAVNRSKKRGDGVVDGPGRIGYRDEPAGSAATNKSKKRGGATFEGSVPRGYVPAEAPDVTVKPLEHVKIRKVSN